MYIHNHTKDNNNTATIKQQRKTSFKEIPIAIFISVNVRI